MSSAALAFGAIVPALVGLAPARLPLSVYIEDTDAYAVVFCNIHAPKAALARTQPAP